MRTQVRLHQNMFESYFNKSGYRCPPYFYKLHPVQLTKVQLSSDSSSACPN